MADDLSGASAELIETLQRLNSSFRATGDALEQSTDTSNQNQRALAAEFEKLGITLKGENTLLNTHAERVKERIRLEQEVNEQLKASGQVRQTATDAEIEEYKLTQKRNVLYESELASLGRVIDQNGKIVKSQVELEGAQKRSIAAIKKEEQARNEQEQALKQFSDMVFKDMPKQGVMLMLNQAFDTFAAGVTGAYKATIAYEDALLAGTRGMRVDAAATAAKMQEMAKVTAKLGSSLTGMGDQFIAVGVGMAFLGGPLTMLAGILAVIIGVAFKFEGLQKEQEAAMQERNAELVKKQAEINDKLAAGFTKLGEATIAGSDGMTGLRDRLYSMTLAMTDLEGYNKVLVENKKNLANLGGTMVEGVKSFSSVASQLIKSSLGKTLEDMGIGVEEMMGHTIQFMAYQNRLGLKTTGDVSKATGEYILELDRLAAITGTTRKEQEEARESILKEQKVQAALMIAEQNDDTEEVKRLKAVIDTAAILKSAGLTKEASDFALNQAMKGTITDAGTARAAQFAGGKGGATEMLRNREYDPVKLAESIVGKMRVNEKALAGTTLLTGGTSLGTDNLYAMNNFGKTLDKLKEEYAAAKKTDPKLQFNDFLDNQRKVTDGWRQGQVELERKQRAEQQAKETAILAGQMDTMAKAFQAPADGMMGAAYKMWDAVKDFAKAVANFMKNPIENTKEFFTGKDKAQRDAEELQEVSKQIEGLKKALSGNPEEMKKTADANLEVAKKEFKARDDYVTQLNEKYNRETDREKKKKIEQEQILAQDASTAARRKMLMAETDVTSAEKAIKAASDPRRQAMMKKQLEGLETKQKELTSSVQAAGPSKTALPGNPGGVATSADQLKDSGLILKPGDTQRPGAKVDPRLLEIAKQVQANTPGFMYFSGFNDQYHAEKTPNSRHVKGLAFDMVVNPGAGKDKPSKEDDKAIQSAIKAAGGQYGVNVKNEYEDTSGKFRTGGHYHVELPLPGAFDGGVFEGPKSGYPVELHGREAVVPLANFGDKPAVDNNQSGTASKTSLSNIMGDNSSGNDVALMLANMFSMMENKLDDMIDKLDTGNNYSDKLVKAMV
jgi:hypothetical protein